MELQILRAVLTEVKKCVLLLGFKNSSGFGKEIFCLFEEEKKVFFF